MGVYEIITGITENEENLKVEIRQTEGTLERNLVYIKNTKTNRAYSFTLADGDEYGADAMTRNAVAKLHSDMCGCNEKTLDRIEHALGIKLETWQSEYILSQGITYFYEIEDTEFWKQVKEIDSKPMTDRQIAMALSKARETLKIVVDTKALKKTIRSMINKKDYPDDDTHIDLGNTTDKELKAIEICFREQED